MPNDHLAVRSTRHELRLGDPSHAVDSLIVATQRADHAISQHVVQGHEATSSIRQQTMTLRRRIPILTIEPPIGRVGELVACDRHELL